MSFINITRKTWNLVVILLAIAAVSTAILITLKRDKNPLPVYSKMGDHPQLLQMNFTNQLGEQVQMTNYIGKVLLVDFIFTHCPTICPDMTRNMRDVQLEFGNNSDLQILSFTVDPERDSVDRMHYFASRFDVDDDGWHFLTGDKKDIYQIARKGFTVTAMEGDGGPDDFIHSPVFVLVDPKMRLRGFYDGTDSLALQQLRTDLAKLL